MSANKQSRAIAHSKKHNHVVVCNNLGKVSIRCADDLDKRVQTLTRCGEWCEVVRYSPCENFLAVGSHDDHLYLYSIDAEAHEYKELCKVKRHSSFINALDWSLDSKHVRTSSGDHEVLYFDVEQKAYDAHGSETAKDIDWASNSIKYGVDRAGIQPTDCDKTHINDVCSTKDASLMLTADDYGLVNVFNYPNPRIEDSRSFAGHSEHVVRVCVSQDQNHVFTIGGSDRALIQWKVTKHHQDE